MKRNSLKYRSNGSFTKNGKNGQNTPLIGLLEWFHFKDFDHVDQTIKHLKALGIKELRTGFSWADAHRSDGMEWFDWYIPRLAECVNILPCFLYTPPSIGLEPKTSAPPQNPYEYGNFIGEMLDKYGQYFEYVELWNEPNNQSEYDYTLDQNWTRFSTMIGHAAEVVKAKKKKSVLGGMSPVDPNWLEMMQGYGALQIIDAVGIHGFPDVFDSHWPGWDTIVKKVKNVLQDDNKEIWITEVGYSTWNYDQRQQLKQFLNAIKAPVDRVYWYSLNDLESRHPTVDGFHLDEREYHFGIVTNRKPKLLYKLLKERGTEKIIEDDWLADPYITSVQKRIDDQQHILITGGAGFIGINLANRLLMSGHRVTILDNLSRDGVEKNIRWIKQKYSKNLNIIVYDVRSYFAVKETVKKADMVFHLAGQVAVTTSFKDPAEDFEVNARGTINILNALREMDEPPPLVFTSTNKVYGRCKDIKLELNGDFYQPVDQELLEHGIGENQNLDFCSPYGCSKGTADQYVLDHARDIGLKTVVFRMSCIYGPHQCGCEDQGWLAHFIIKALKGEPITIFGNGKQVRDILYVEDLVNAFLTAWKKIDVVSGQVFNMGGGVRNAVSLLKVIEKIEDVLDEKIEVQYASWRPGDQKYYISDIRKFSTMTGWQPKVDAEEGIHLLLEWMKDNLPQVRRELKFKKRKNKPITVKA